MPRESKESVVMRQWELLHMLSISRSSSRDMGVWDKSSDLRNRLEERGFPISLRSVQRDLQALATRFPLEVNDKNPNDFGWRWMKGARLDIQGLTLAEALTLVMAEMYLSPMLPGSTLAELAPLFETSKSRIETDAKSNANSAQSWLEKIRVVPAAQPFLAPDIDPDIQAVIYRALLDNKKLSVHYTAINYSTSKQYELNPLGLLLRGPIHYLVASESKDNRVKLFALHRFNSAQIVLLPCEAPGDFNLDDAIANGLGEFSRTLENIQLKLICSDAVVNRLKETPLTKNQKIVEEDGKWIVLAELSNSWQLRFWIRSQGSQIEVCEPEFLRYEIKQDLIKALSRYA